MISDEVKEVINETAKQTAIAFKKSKLIKADSKNAFMRTEELLKNYNSYKFAIDNLENVEQTKKMLGILDKAIDNVKDDKYYDIIPMIYFDEFTREDVAEQFGVNVKTINRNKNRLINKLKYILFSEQTIEELLFK